LINQSGKKSQKLAMKSLPMRSPGALALLLVACAKPPILSFPPPKPEPIPTVVNIELRADEKVNVDRRGRATPIVVRYYLLQSTASFDSADFFSLIERDEAVLGAAKIVREELAVQPGQTLTYELRPQGDARHLAIFAAYREVNRARWRASIPIPPNKTSAYAIQIGPGAVTITAKAP
jgi:type VI secretion system protein VasD